MTDLEIYALENKYGVRGVDSEANGLKYFYDDEKRALGISGRWGMTMLTPVQLAAFAREAQGLLELLGVDKELRPRGRKGAKA